jgi:hypothetical protein
MTEQERLVGDHYAVVTVPPSADCGLGGNVQSGHKDTPEANAD